MIIAGLITLYIVTWLIGTTVFLGVTEDAKDLRDVPELWLAYVIGFFWPLALAAGAIFLVGYGPYLGLRGVYRGTNWAKREIKNPKENVKELA